MMPTAQNVTRALPKVLACDCQHDFQDRRFGKGRRLCNPTMKMAGKDGPSQYRCTVCGKLNGG